MKHSMAKRSSSAKRYSRMDNSIVKKLPKKKFFEKTQGIQKNSNSMYMLDEQDLDRNFLNEGLKISPQSANNLEEAEEQIGMSDFKGKERSHSQPPNKIETNKSYESDKNSFEELEHNENLEECQ